MYCPPGLFEGFAGAGSDIDAIFEVEDDFESALDMGDDDEPDRRIRQWPRKDSNTNNVRPNFKGHSPQRGDKRSSSTPPLVPRIRIDSLMPARPFDTGSLQQSFSPLARVFQPIVVDSTESVIEEIGGDQDNNADGISYGPASRRRRLTSIAQGKRPSKEALLQQAQANAALKRFPVPALGRSPSSPPTMPAQRQQQVPVPIPVPAMRRRNAGNRGSSVERAMTVEQVRDDVGGGVFSESPEVLRLARQMTEMEKRQERIEALLMQISDRLSRK